ncbi:MAG TPA: hypothetical protein VH482_15925 [Thermomicrobiales bacterium]|jgi:hypothetical protein
MESRDFPDRTQAPPFFPTNLWSPRAEAAPRCRRCAAVLVVAHLRCDDDALLPVYRCPICRHAATGESSTTGPTLRIPSDDERDPVT